MRTKIFTLLTGVSLLGGSVHAQLQRIVLQGNGDPQVFTSIHVALAAAQPNDRLYFSGGTFGDSTITITIPLHFIGAGIGPDSSAVTGTTTLATANNSGDDIVITTGASGSTFTGIRFNPDGYFYHGHDGTDDDPTGLVFQRCVFDKRVYMTWDETTASSSSTYEECIFHSLLVGGDGVNATLSKCILDYQAGTGAEVTEFGTGGLTMRHCICLGTRIGNSANCVVENSIFTRTSAPFWQSNGATLTNNLLVSPILVSNMSPGAASGNVLGVNEADIFINEDNTDFEWSDDVHLQDTSVGVGMASDGTDVGIYGSSTPWKEGSAPFNPHFRSATIAPATNGNGDLPVNIRVAAQTH